MSSLIICLLGRDTLCLVCDPVWTITVTNLCSDWPAAGNPLVCSEARFKCRNGRCVDRSFLCNGQDNCQDNSDEELCLTTTGKLRRATTNQKWAQQVTHLCRCELVSYSSECCFVANRQVGETYALSAAMSFNHPGNKCRAGRFV